MNKRIPTFNELYQIAPVEVQKFLDGCAQTPQSEKWHPEGNVLKHTKIVFERARKSGDLDMTISALFHDLGKVKATKRNKHGSWSSYGHEFISAKIVEENKEWIQSLGANPERVHEIVKNHMKIKLMDEMRPSKQQEVRNLESYNDLLKFTDFDNMKTLTADEMDGKFDS